MRRRWVVAVPSAWVVAVLLFLVLAPLDSTVALAVAAFVALTAVGLAVVQVRGFREFADALADRARQVTRSPGPRPSRGPTGGFDGIARKAFAG